MPGMAAAVGPGVAVVGIVVAMAESGVRETACAELVEVAVFRLPLQPFTPACQVKLNNLSNLISN